MVQVHLLRELEYLTAHSPGELLWTLFSVTMIDLVLSGDNAAVIALAVRGLPPNIRKKAAAYGITIGIILQVIFTLFATKLMTIPYLTALGGTSLLAITAKLLTDHPPSALPSEPPPGEKTFLQSLCFLLLANLSMSLDNVLGVAGAAGGSYLLVFASLLLSIPLLILGADWIGSILTAHPTFLFLSGAILTHTAINMICGDTALSLTGKIAPLNGNILGWLAGGAVLIYGCIKKTPTPDTSDKQQPNNQSNA